ncbi:MAG TPA: Ig-like domain-containing protein [Myxococcaceae bacterium]|nr:Ig-like domain-containing protein [Myxococcaceae bacterium]
MTTSIAARAFSKALVVALALLTACGDSNPTVVEPPPAAVASVAVSPPTQSIVLGQPVTLEAQPKAADGTNLDREVRWTSEDESKATVSATGVVTTLAEGEVGIRATSEGKFGRAVLTILPVPPVPVAEVRLSVDDEIVLEWDGIAQVSATAYDAQGNVLVDRHVQWSSNRPSIAAVVNGTIEARNPGTATITAVVEGVPASVGVRVREAPVVEVFIDPFTTGLEIDETFDFSSRVKRANGAIMYEPVSWSSDSPAVARVDGQFFWYAWITAVSEGPFRLTATLEGVSTSMALTVTARPTHDLIYNRWANDSSEIFTLSLATAGAIPVRINAGKVSRGPSPSPDGTQLVFAVSQTLPGGEVQNDLYVVRRDGLNMRRLTSMPGWEDEPKWSPNGNRILFQATVDNRPDLYVINVDGTGLTNVTAFIGAEMTDKRHPAWSPDGARIAFTGAVGGQHRIYTIDANGSNLKQITTDPGFDQSPTFSHDATQIAFSRYNGAATGYGWDIMIVSSQGGTPVRLSLPGDQHTPAWSPDGKYIAVGGTAVAGTGATEIYTMRPDGTGLRLRTVNPAGGGGGAPAWIARP